MARRPKSRTLTSKDVKMGVKNGFTVYDFCKKFGIMSETTFIECLEHAYPNGGSEQALREIRKNEKNRRARSTKKVTINQQRKKGGMAVSQPITTNREDRLEDLKNQETALSSEVIKLEVEHKELVEKHRNLRRTANEILTEINLLDTKLQDKKAEYREVVDTNNEVIRSMNSLSEDRVKKLASLDAIRAEIESLTIVSIAVFNDCTYDIVEGDFSIDLSQKEGEISALVHQLVDKEICADLTARQIRVISELMQLGMSTTQKLEFIFDNSAMEQAYYNLVSSEPLSA